MFKRKKTAEAEFVDNARERLMTGVLIDRLKDIGLFIVVAVVLMWLVLGVM